MRPPAPGIGRPAPARPGSLVRNALDLTAGLLATGLEVLVCGMVVFLADQPERDFSRPPVPDPGPPPMDWTTTLVLGSFAAAVCLIGLVLLRHGLPLAGIVQLIAAGVFCVLALVSWHSHYRAAHPEGAAPAAFAPDRAGHRWTGRAPDPGPAAGRPQATTTIAPGAPWSPRTEAGRARFAAGEGFIR
ncbi:hypothetical protein [Streptomyces sp. NPDC057682]|uniref:hypothetical protein n=1 Tax=unclassified Streptomyces TaxID=2593676 RepID=UPI003657A0AE